MRFYLLQIRIPLRVIGQMLLWSLRIKNLQRKPAKESQGGKEENFRGIKGHNKTGHREHDCRAGRGRYGVLS